MKKQKTKQKISSKRQKIYLKYDGRCAYCGKVLDIHQMTVDHVLPQVKGGKGNIENLLPACQKCNCEKGSLSLKEYRREKAWQHLSMTDMQEMIKSYSAFKKAFTVKARNYKFYFEKGKNRHGYFTNDNT